LSVTRIKINSSNIQSQSFNSVYVMEENQQYYDPIVDFSLNKFGTIDILTTSIYVDTRNSLEFEKTIL